MKVTVSFCLAALMSLLCACSNTEQKPLLMIHFDRNPDTQILAVYDDNGDCVYEDITPDSVGNIVYNPEFAGDGIDIQIIVGNKSYGARIEKGKSTTMSFADGNVTFGGDNIAASRFYNEYARAYNPWRFKLAAGEDTFNYQSVMVRAAADHDAVAAHLNDIEDRSLAEFYRNLNDHAYRYSTYSFMSMDERANETDHSVEKDSLLKLIDPNEDAARISGTLQHWYFYSPENQETGSVIRDARAYCTERIHHVDSVLTNQANKRNLYYMIVQDYLMFNPSKSDIDSFIQETPELANETRLMQIINEMIEKKANIVENGSPLPSDPTLISPDGNRVQLSEVLAPGKVTYIDMWATWCVPCCREIPYMEKLAQEYTGNDKIQFISISCDDDHDAWRAKIEKDNPCWPQYVLEGASGKKFMDAMDAHAIPRFFLIGGDGTFIDVNAPRPSSDEVRDMLNQAIGNL